MKYLMKNQNLNKLDSLPSDEEIKSLVEKPRRLSNFEIDSIISKESVDSTLSYIDSFNMIVKNIIPYSTKFNFSFSANIDECRLYYCMSKPFEDKHFNLFFILEYLHKKKKVRLGIEGGITKNYLIDNTEDLVFSSDRLEDNMMMDKVFLFENNIPLNRLNSYLFIINDRIKLYYNYCLNKHNMALF